MTFLSWEIVGRPKKLPSLRMLKDESLSASRYHFNLLSPYGASLISRRDALRPAAVTGGSRRSLVRTDPQSVRRSGAIFSMSAYAGFHLARLSAEGPHTYSSLRRVLLLLLYIR